MTPTPRASTAWSEPTQVPGLAALALAMLAGCASVAPPPVVPPLPVPAAYPEAAPAAAGAADAAGLAWRQAFGDAQLQRLVVLALANNRDLRRAVLRVQEARTAYGLQRADALPALAVSAEASRARLPGDLNASGRPVTAGEYRAGLGLAAWELDFWGRVRSLQAAALERYLASDAARRALTMVLVTQVAQGYLVLRELDERVALAGQTVRSRDESLRIFRRRFEVGAVSRLELAQVQTLATQARALAAQLAQARAAQAHALALLVGAPIELPADGSRLDDASTVPPLRAGLPSDLLQDRPDIVAAEHRLRAAQADIGAARAAFFPRITLTGSVGTASAALDGLFASGSRAWAFAPSVLLPVFDGGRRQAGLDLAALRRDLAVADYETAVQTAFREVADALSAQRWLGEQLLAEREALASQAERARLAQLRYDAGSATFLEVLDAQRDLLAAGQQLVQTQRALLSARVALYAALGGGSREVAATDPPPGPPAASAHAPP
ncbi:efflux transporter outer membrane subunit [Aquincola sp. MAHUQ-54]|uniref:Efflux transporter outer membrane subunit n=1 Tax=Aquincola agrisoli TaxID=3119538 RepID=A0AAW9QML0_9BURK